MHNKNTVFVRSDILSMKRKNSVLGIVIVCLWQCANGHEFTLNLGVNMLCWEILSHGQAFNIQRDSLMRFNYDCNLKLIYTYEQNQLKNVYL